MCSNCKYSTNQCSFCQYSKSNFNLWILQMKALTVKLEKISKEIEWIERKYLVDLTTFHWYSIFLFQETVSNNIISLCVFRSVKKLYFSNLFHDNIGPRCYCSSVVNNFIYIWNFNPAFYFIFLLIVRRLSYL